MENVNIRKEELIQILEKNIVMHKTLYDESMQAFKKNYYRTLTELAEDAKSEKFGFTIQLQLPKNHEQDYRDAIKMISMYCRDIIILSEDEFRSYVLNKWDWIHSFRTCYMSNVYSTSPSTSPSNSPSSSVAMEYFGQSWCGKE